MKERTSVMEVFFLSQFTTSNELFTKRILQSFSTDEHLYQKQKRKTIMKNLRLIISLIAIVFLNQAQAQSCQAALNITQGTAPGEYIFTDNSTNAVYGNLSIYGSTQSNYQLTSTNPSVSHTFQANGLYLYMYAIYDNGTCSDTLFDTLSVTSLPPCNVQAVITFSNGSNPGEFILTDNSTKGESP